MSPAAEEEVRAELARRAKFGTLVGWGVALLALAFVGSNLWRNK